MARRRAGSALQNQRPISDRDRQIYHEVTAAGRTQRDVAARFQISQARVSKVVKTVSRKLTAIAAAGPAALSPRAAGDGDNGLRGMIPESLLEELIQLGKRAEGELQARRRERNPAAKVAEKSNAGTGIAEYESIYYCSHVVYVYCNSTGHTQQLFTSPALADRPLSPPFRALSPDAFETHLDREIAEPNDFHTTA